MIFPDVLPSLQFKSKYPIIKLIVGYFEITKIIYLTLLIVTTEQKNLDNVLPVTNLQKFPFKSMLPIINFLNAHPNASAVYDIMDSSNACFSDTSEVLEMLSYLTAFGKVYETSSGWVISQKQVVPSQKMFRERYLVDVIAILNVLREKPQELDSLSSELAGIPKDTIEVTLKFLEQLSAHGFVQKVSQGWKVVNYELVKEIET